MELNRNHYFMVGLIILLLGLQLRSVQAFVLNKKCSEFVAMKLKSQQPQLAQKNPFMMSIASPSASIQKQTIVPPKWLGWALVSVGAVLILHSLAMGRPN